LWNDGVIVSMSLSKIGLPGARTGIIVADASVINALSSANAILSLANGNLGQYLAEPLFGDGSIETISREHITPLYRERSAHAVESAQHEFGDSVPWAVHRIEGSIFLWLWLPDLPISTIELYGRLKERGVIVVPGEYFFFEDEREEAWDHGRQCLRINYGLDADALRRGMAIIAEEVRSVWRA
jgi:valine--pyruvate aminotransferase